MRVRHLIRQNQSKLNMLHVFIDAVLSVSSCVAAYFLFRLIFSVDVVEDLKEYKYQIIYGVPAVTAVLQLVFNKVFDLYRSYRSSRFGIEITNLVRSGMAVFVLLIAAAIATSSLFELQIPIMFYFFINTILSTLYRALLRALLKAMRSRGYNLKRIVFVGVNDCTDMFIKKISSSPDLGYELSGYFDHGPHNKIELPYLGNFKSLSKYFSEFHPDEAVIMLSDRAQSSFSHIVAICENWGVKFSIIPNMFSAFSSRIYISSFDGMPVMSMRNVPLDNTFNKFIKRTLDIIVSLLMLVVLSPIMLVTAVIIKLTSPGKIIFKQQRVGLGKKPFTMYKFRSMREDTGDNITMTKKNDVRVTDFGRFIRRFSIDELPQLFNVLKGDMSLVGPRPEIPFYVKEFRKSVPLYMVKHYVKPGMTGWAQVNDLRGGNTSIPERIRYDIYYIENWSVGFDIKILFKTLFKAIFSKTAC